MYDLEHPARRAGGVSPAVPAAEYEYLREIAAASFLHWGEHCIECAAPACFASCDLYEERPDGLCRRFVQGIAPNYAFPSARGYGAQVSFKKWGKLEARGNTALIPHRRLLTLEGLINRSKPALAWLGATAWRVTGDNRWRSALSRALDRTARRLHVHRDRRARPDVFLLEVCNPCDQAVAIHLCLTVARKDLLQRGLKATALLPSFARRLELKPGYSCHQIDYSELSSVTESGLPFDIALVPEADSAPTLVFLSTDFVQFSPERAAPAGLADAGPPVKCVVWDLDNTLWKGVLLEDGQIQPDSVIMELIRDLDSRGVLLSVASKNDFDLAIEKMTEIGIEEYMLYPQINWKPKSDGIKLIAEKLNIGLDTFMFVDDNEFELEEVSRTLPMVSCVNVRDIAKLAKNPRLRGTSTSEARRRRSMYREAMTRELEERKFGSDFFAFLRSCDIKVRLLPYMSEYFERVCELLQRTNQLNFSGRKYERGDIREMLGGLRHEKWVLECSDKFGSYGVVGFSFVSRTSREVWIDDFMLSCRVQGRFVEQAFFAALVGGDPAMEKIVVNFNSTGRNTPAQDVLLTMGFEAIPGQSRMGLDLRNRVLACDFITVEREAPARTDVSTADVSS